MHSPATTPDDIRAAVKHSPHTTPPTETGKITQPHPSDSMQAQPEDRSQTSPQSRHRMPDSRKPRINRWLHYAAVNRQRGMSTAEYAVGTIAACAFAALLFKVVSSTEVQEMLTSLIDRALNTTTG